MAGCAVLKALGTLSGWILVTAEVSRSGAESRVFPALFREGIDGPPRRNLLIVAGLMSVIVVLSSLAPTLSAQFTMLINIATLLYLVIYAYCCAALWRFTRNPGIRAGCRCWPPVSASGPSRPRNCSSSCTSPCCVRIGVPLYMGLRDDTPAR